MRNGGLMVNLAAFGLLSAAFLLSGLVGLAVASVFSFSMAGSFLTAGAIGSVLGVLYLVWGLLSGRGR